MGNPAKKTHQTAMAVQLLTMCALASMASTADHLTTMTADMHNARQPHSPTAQKLPFDVLVGLLDQAPDPVTLVALGTTCRALWNHLKHNGDRLIGDSLRRDVPDFRILEAATLTHRCSPPPLQTTGSRELVLSLKPDDMDDAEFAYRIWVAKIDDYKAQVREIDEETIRWTIPEALRISSYHREVISKLVWWFIDECSLDKSVPLMASLEEARPTVDEQRRISVAFYRFELIRRAACLPFFGDKHAHYESRFTRNLEAFFTWHSVSQMMCIKEFLGRMLVRRARDEIRQRQRQGENESELPPPPVDMENARIHALIAQGLEWLVAYIGQERPRAYVTATEDDQFLWELFDIVTEDLYFSWTTRFGAFLDTGSFIGGALIGDNCDLDHAYEHGAPDLLDNLWGYSLWDQERVQAIRKAVAETDAGDDRVEEDGAVVASVTDYIYPSGIVATLWPDGKVPEQ